MGITFLILLVASAICLFTWCINHEKRDQKVNAVICVIVCTLVSGILCGAGHFKSYTTYLLLAGQLATIEQYKTSIDMYSEKGLNIPAGEEITDLKYNNYQDQIGKMIRELRDCIVSYNIMYTKKQLLKKSFMFGWYIYLPDGMKPVLIFK